jgi:cellulose synthase operon protein C
MAGKKEEFRQRLVDLLKAAPRKERWNLLRLLAVQARADGNDDEAVSWLRQGILADHGEGLRSEEVDKATLLAFILMEDGRFAEARQALTGLKIIGLPADSRYKVAYYLGLLGDWVGDYRSALENLRQASDLAERGGLVQSRLRSEQVRARILQELGRSEEASEIFTHLHVLLPDVLLKKPVDYPCDEASLLINEAWSRLLAGEGGEKAEDPTPTLKRAEALFDAPCGQPAQRLNVRLNLALADQQEHRWSAARQALSEAEGPSLASRAKLDQRLWWLDLKGRQAIAEGDPGGALDLYDQLAKLAREAQSSEGGFRAAVGRAHAQEKLDRPAEATASFQQADRLIDEETLHIPAYEGRDSFVAQRELEMRRYLQLLLDRGLRQDAFDLVRRDRSRLLRQLAVRDRLAHLTSGEQQRWDQSLSEYWSLRAEIDHEAAQESFLPGDELKRVVESRAGQLDKARKELDHAMFELGDPRTREEGRPPPPGPGEVILAYHPLPEGWVGFAASSEGIKVATFDLPEDALADPRAPRSLEALASRLLGPFESVVQRARLVRVLPFGPLRSVDFHALPFVHETLLAKIPVVYGLDLPTHLSTAPVGRPVALLVADPEGNLPEAQKESKKVADTVRGWGQGWTPKRLDGTDASEDAVREALLGADLFDFAGHGVFEDSGWDSALLLAAGSRLTPRDLLTLRRVPAWVVLSTCEGGRSSKEAPGEGIGLAQAFLLAGSQAVVATTRPVRDTEARDFVVELYRGWRPGMDLAQQVRRAQLACRRKNPAADWASFRLLEP